MGLLLGLQGVLSQLPDAMQAIDDRVLTLATEVQAGGEIATVTCARASTAPSASVTSASANAMRAARPHDATVCRRACPGRAGPQVLHVQVHA